jgi:hypothetical protein
MWSVAVVALATGRQLEIAMPLLLLVDMPCWVLLGWLAGRRIPRGPPKWNPYGLSGLAFAGGAVAFWMIPRSVDAIAASPLVDQLMHATLLMAGATLAISVPFMPFVVRGALAIYGTSMTFALGMLYTNYRALLCGTFNLAQQRMAGQWLLASVPFLVLLVLAWGARALARFSPEAAQ